MVDGARTWKRFCYKRGYKGLSQNVKKAFKKALVCAKTISSIRVNYCLVYNTLEIPTHCCVPECIKKGYREEDGSKVSYFQFPIKKMLKKKWIQAIRRDEGKDFKISESTKVCSRHFRKEYLKKTLAGKICLKFSWILTSPRKRKPPTERYMCEPVASPSAAPSSSRSDASPESVSRFEMQIKPNRSKYCFDFQRC